MSVRYGRVCPDLQRSLQEIVRRIVELESQGLFMQAEEERADDDAYRVEKQLRKLQVAKQGDDRDLTEAKLWLSSIAQGRGDPGLHDTAGRTKRARGMIQLISRSLLRRCAEGHQLNEKRVELRAREEACELAGYELAEALKAIQSDLVAAVTAGISASGL